MGVGRPLEIASEDLRDAKLSIAPDGQFMLGGAGARRQDKHESHQSYAWFSRDGRSWSEALPVADPDYWLWRVTWHKGVCYGIGYDCRNESNIRLYRSEDGRRFKTHVASLLGEGYPNETSIVFLPDDTAVCLLRRDQAALGARRQANGLVGTARPPYLEWAWKDTGRRIGGPHLLRLPDGRFLAAVRLYDGRVRTSLCWLDPAGGRLDECLALPSGGDTSYAGLALHDGLLWVSYYSSHEQKTSIYLAKVRIPAHVKDRATNKSGTVPIFAPAKMGLSPRGQPAHSAPVPLKVSAALADLAASAASNDANGMTGREGSEGPMR